MRLNSWQTTILTGYVMIALLFGVVFLLFYDKIPKALADMTVSDRYYLPAGVKSSAVASRDRKQRRLAQPGSTVTVSISGRSTQYRYELLAAADAVPEKPVWMDGGKMPLDQAPTPAWAASLTAAGDHDPYKYDAICDFYINGQFSRRGPCKGNSAGANLIIKIAEDDALVGKYVGVAFRTSTGDRMLSWQVSAQDQSDWIRNDANFGDLTILAGIVLLSTAVGLLYLLETERITIDEN